jgi:hypothetical protein
MTRAEFWGKQILQKDPSSEKEIRTLLKEASKEVKSKNTTDDGSFCGCLLMVVF